MLATVLHAGAGHSCSTAAPRCCRCCCKRCSGTPPCCSGLVLSPGGIVVLYLHAAGGHPAAPLPAALAGDLRRASLRRRAVHHVRLQPVHRLPHRRVEPHGAEPGPGVPVRAHQHRGLRLHSPRSAPTTPPGCSTWRATSAAASGIATITTLLRPALQLHQQSLVEHLTPLRRALPPGAGGRRRRCCTRHGASLPDAAAQAHGLIYGSMLQPGRHAGVPGHVLGDGRAVPGDHPLMFLIGRPRRVR